MGRVALGIEYDGSAYAGWQTQQSLQTIQQLLEASFSRVAAAPVDLVCAGRTDAGVHARGQVAHFDTLAIRPMRGWVLGGNTYLPKDISVVWARLVPMHFHARYSAEARTYRYLILNRGSRSALAAGRATCIHQPIDELPMIEAARALLGQHDFSAFRSSECQSRSPVRKLEALTVQRRDEWIVIEATANAFLHHMMRNIAGLLIAIGRGDLPVGYAEDLLKSCDRRLGAATAPADGLYLWSVRYPEAFHLPPAGGSGLSDQSAMIPASV